MEFLQTYSLIINLLVLAMPFALAVLALTVWLGYRRLKYQRYVVGAKLFEIKLPPEVTKSPLAMELILKALYDKSYGTYLERFIDGRVPPHFSFEIASFGGSVHFYMWIPGKFAKIAVNSFYAQYPSVEVVEVDDYTRGQYWNPEKMMMWGGDFILTKPDVVSIATYKMYQLDMNPDVENTVDPLASLLEYMGSLGYGEQCWLQILIRGDHEKNWKNGQAMPFKPKPTLKSRLDKFIDDLKENSRTVFIDSNTGEERKGLFNFEPGQSDNIKDLRTQQDMYHFDTYIRGIYLSRHETFNGINIPTLIKSIQQFGHQNANGLAPAHNTDLTDPQKDWARMNGFIKNYYSKKRADSEKEFLAAYKRRSAFYEPHHHLNHAPFTMTTEEIATLYHLPSTATTTPTLNRVDARKADPPSNLPI